VTPHNTCFLRPTRVHNPNGISIGSAVVAHLTSECMSSGKSGHALPLNIAPSHGGSGTPSNTRFLGPTRVLKPNGISIDSTVFAGFTTVTDRQTDRPTDHATRSVTISRMCNTHVLLRCGLVIMVADSQPKTVLLLLPNNRPTSTY